MNPQKIDTREIEHFEKIYNLFAIERFISKNIIISLLPDFVKADIKKMQFLNAYSQLRQYDFTEFLKYRSHDGTYINYSTFINAAETDKLQIMMLLCDNNCPWTKYIYVDIGKDARGGTKVGVTKNCSTWNKWIFSHAASNGSLPNMKWLYQNGCPWDENTFVHAVKRGLIPNMEWLRSMDCPWDVRAFNNAVGAGGSDETILWLKEHECPWDETTFKAAVESGNMVAMAFLLENGCPYSPYIVKEATNNVAVNVQTIKWLEDNCTPANMVMPEKKTEINAPGQAAPTVVRYCSVM